MGLHTFTLPDASLFATAAVEQATLLLAISKNRQDIAQQVLDNSGGGTIVGWHHQPNTWEPSWVSYRQPGVQGVAIYGTTNGIQIAGHLMGAVGVPYFEDPAKVNCHALHYGAYLDLSTRLKAEMPDDGTSRILISGHSYGGAIAAFFVGEKPEPGITYCGPRVQVMTFGQPRVFAGAFSPQAGVYVRIVNGRDPVPHLPPIRTNLLLGKLLPIHVKAMSFLKNWGHWGQPFLVGPDGEPVSSPTQGNGTFEDIKTLTNANIAHHAMDEYATIMRDYCNRQPPPSPEYSLALRSYATAAINNAPVQNDNVSIPQASYINPPVANAVYADPGGVPFTAGNLPATQGLSVETALVGLPPQTLNGGPYMASSGFWKITAFVGNGQSGDSVSVTLSKTVTSATEFAQVIASAQQWARFRATMLGFNFAAGATPRKDISCPAVTYIRIADAMSPRNSTLLAVTIANGSGVGTLSTPADRLSTSVSFRMLGQRADGQTAYQNHILTGQPDTVCSAGAYNGDTVPVGPANAMFSSVLSSYVLFLTSTSGGTWGFLGRGAAPALQFQKVNSVVHNVDGFWHITMAAAQTWQEGDTIYLSRANTKGWDGATQIGFVSTTEFKLLNTRLSSKNVPFTNAYARVIKYAPRTPAVVPPQPKDFYTFIPMPQGPLNVNSYVKISKKDLAREFNPTSFRHRHQLVTY